MLTSPGARHYAFSGFRHRTAEITSFLRNLGFRAAGFDALEKPLGPAATGRSASTTARCSWRPRGWSPRARAPSAST